MSRFGFLARKSAPAEKPDEPAATTSENPLELDEELFSTLGAQLGGENEALRNMLLDANNKIGELDTIKAAVGKLVDPVSKALRDFEAEKTEKVGLQTVLNNTRTAYGKLRNEVGDLEKKLAASERECQTLRQDLAAAQSLLHTLETTKTDFSIDLAAARAQIADLESNLAQRTGECLALREENRRFDERLVTTEKRAIALESDLGAARQRLLIAEDEKRAQQIQLDKAGTETARMSRKLTETEASFNAVQGRLRHAEATINEANIERARLVTTLDEVNERHERERTGQNMRFELAAGARDDARKGGGRRARTAARPRRTDPRIRPAQRRNRDRAQRLAGAGDQLQAALIEFESKYKEADQTRTAYMERNGDAGARPHRQGSRLRGSRGRQRRAHRPRRRAGSRAGQREDRPPSTRSRNSSHDQPRRSSNARCWKARCRPPAARLRRAMREVMALQQAGSRTGRTDAAARRQRRLRVFDRNLPHRRAPRPAMSFLASPAAVTRFRVP